MKNLATYPKITVVTIIYGERWKFLSQVVSAVMRDKHVMKLIIVDNGSKNRENIENGVKEYGDRVVVLRQEKNLGSAGGFAKGIECARTTDCDFVLLLDDDSVPEDEFVMKFMDAYSYFPEGKVVLSGNRVNIPGNQEFFYRPSLKNVSPRGTFFEVFNADKITHFFRLLRGFYKKGAARGPFIPIAPTEAFVYGAAFIPIDAVRVAPLPDASLFLYGDDVEYSWRIKKLGYSSYLCSSPKIYDVDLTFGEGSHIFGLFEPQTLSFKVYYRIKNMVRISIRNTHQARSVLFLNIFIWIVGLLVLGGFKYGSTSTYWRRVKLIILAVYGGYFPDANIPREVQSI